MKRKITNVEVFTKDGQLYVRYNVESNNKVKVFERPYYDKDGKVDPEVENILIIAKQMEKKSEENVDKGSKTKEIVPSPVNNLVVYKEPKTATSSKTTRNILGYIAVGLAGALIAAGIMAGSKSCSKTQNNDEPASDIDIDNNPVIEQQDDTDTKIVYMTEEQYLNGVQELTNHLNETLGFNYKPVDLNAFYYSANMDNISDELFTKLVAEQYIPDTDTDIILSTFNITSDLRTKFVVDNNIGVDFSKVFVDNDVIQVSEQYKTKYNNIFTQSSQTAAENSKNTLDDINNYMFDDVEAGYNTLPTGGQFVFNCLVSETIGIKAGEMGVSVTPAFESEISDLSDYVNGLRNHLNCTTMEPEKVLTK